MLSCVSLSMCSRISASSSSIIRLPRPMNCLLLRPPLLLPWPLFRCSPLFDCPKNPRDRSRQFVPLARFHLQLLPSSARQPVKLRAPVVLRRALFHGDPSPFDEPVQRRIQ